MSCKLILICVRYNGKWLSACAVHPLRVQLYVRAKAESLHPDLAVVFGDRSRQWMSDLCHRGGQEPPRAHVHLPVQPVRQRAVRHGGLLPQIPHGPSVLLCYHLLQRLHATRFRHPLVHLRRLLHAGPDGLRQIRGHLPTPGLPLSHDQAESVRLCVPLLVLPTLLHVDEFCDAAGHQAVRLAHPQVVLRQLDGGAAGLLAADGQHRGGVRQHPLLLWPLCLHLLVLHLHGENVCFVQGGQADVYADMPASPGLAGHLLHYSAPGLNVHEVRLEGRLTESLQFNGGGGSALPPGYQSAGVWIQANQSERESVEFHLRQEKSGEGLYVTIVRLLWVIVYDPCFTVSFLARMYLHVYLEDSAAAATSFLLVSTWSLLEP